MKIAAPVIFLIASLCLVNPFAHCRAGVFPAEGAVLNYRIIGFSFPSVPDASYCQVQIAIGSIPGDTSFIPLLTTSPSEKCAIISEVPSFGESYTWRAIYFSGKKMVAKSPLYHFSTGVIPTANAIDKRLRVTQNDRSDQFYILSDGANVMFDTGGKVVWYLPQKGGPATFGSDIKITDRHTITCILGRAVAEMTYNGDVIWQFPVNKSVVRKGAPPANTITFHHEFSRLPDGHYLALGSEPFRQNGELSAKEARGGGARGSTHHFFPASLNGVLFEFDSVGKIVWTWRSSDYFVHSDIGALFDDMDKWQSPAVTSHENAFYFDEKKQVIYLSLAAFNRIVAISFPSGKVVSTFGPLYDRKAGYDTLLKPGGLLMTNVFKDHIFKNTLFSGQHACRETQEGNLLLYNNNMFDTSLLPQVVIFRNAGPDRLEKVWEFTCPVGDMPRAVTNEGGGCASQMPDGSLFVTMNFPYNKFFIVDSGKQIQWSALAERKDNADNWLPLNSYRASIITRAELEQMIWSSELISSLRPPRLSAP